MKSHTEPVKGLVKGTGFPIDGHILIFCKWRYDEEKYWHLYDWNQQDDEAVMDTFFQSMLSAGFVDEDFKAEWEEQWKNQTADVPGAFTLEDDQVEIISSEVKEGNE
jgi:hypothetical protein